MFQIQMTVMSKSESLLGLMFDQGDHQSYEDEWIPFTRVRLGFIFFTIDFTWFSKT
jgi:hypothetical protein